MTVKHPLINWAQRSPHIYLTIEVDEMKIEEMVVDGDSFKIKGKKGDDVYEAHLQLFSELKGAERRQIDTDRRVELIIPKEKAEWWPRLLKEKTKMPWIKVDFDKWKDEDEEDDAEQIDEGGPGGFDGMNFSDFGNLGGFGARDLDVEDDEDIDQLEDAEKLGDDEDGESPKPTDRVIIEEIEEVTKEA